MFWVLQHSLEHAFAISYERVHSILHTALVACASSMVAPLPPLFILKSLLFLPLPVSVSHVPIGVLGSQLAHCSILLFSGVLEIELR